MIDVSMIERTELNKRTIGVNFNNPEQADVLLWAPLAKQVQLVLNDKNTTIELERHRKFGYWHTSTPELRPLDRYKFRIDGKDPLPDPASLSQPEGVHQDSAAFDLKQFHWNDSDWNNIPLADYIIYELHTGTFSESGDFAGIIPKLDHLIELGITAIEIMPVAQFPGNRNWGYDGVFPFAVQSSYGGPEKLQELVQACHDKGLAVIMDVVYNHVGPEGNYFGQFGPFFTDKYQTPWGQAINFDDEYCDGVRDYFVENVLMWFRDFHIDALRMDAVHAIKDLSATHILQDIRTHVDLYMQTSGKSHHLIIECDLNDPRFLDGAEKNGFGMDAQWIDEFHHALRVTAGEPANGYYEDFSGIRSLEKAYKDAYVYDGQFSSHRKKLFGKTAADHSGSTFIVFSQNHDQVGNRMLGERSSTLYSYEMQKLLAAAVMCSPYLPMLFMGEEWGETNPFLYFVSHTDQELNMMVRKGRKAEFAAFHSQGEAPDPDREDTFLNSKLQWDLLEVDIHHTMFQYYKALIALRKAHPALHSGDRKNVDVKAYEHQNALLLKRWAGTETIYCFMNFSKDQQTLRFERPAGVLRPLLNSSDAKWNGPNLSEHENLNGTEISLQSESIAIYLLKNE
jgi:maltooligosyltrehalose trehalohydrolase